VVAAAAVMRLVDVWRAAAVRPVEVWRASAGLAVAPSVAAAPVMALPARRAIYPVHQDGLPQLAVTTGISVQQMRSFL